MNKYCIGIDLGGTSIRFCLFDCINNTIIKITKKNFTYYGNVLKEVDFNLCHPIDNIICEFSLSSENLLSIGISSAAIFERHTGNIIKWPNNQTWNGFRMKEFLEKRYNTQVYMEDDSNCAALGELWNGVATGWKSFVYLTISTGISCGIIINEQLYTGMNGWSGEIGHINVLRGGELCKCGKHGCIQTIASGPAIRNKYLKEFNVENENITLGEIAEMVRNQKVDANIVFGEATDCIAYIIEVLHSILDINQFVLGGGVLNCGNIFTDLIEKALVDRSLGEMNNIILRYTDKTDINGLYGSIMLCKCNEMKEG